MDLDEYQRLAERSDQRPGDSEDALAFPMLGIASEAGALVNQFKKRIRDGDSHALFSERIEETLGDVLWYVANLSTKLGFNLDDVASKNLDRIRQRWPLGDEHAPRTPLDEGWPDEERLPERLEAEFREIEVGGEAVVELRLDGEVVGDPLYDMTWEPDHYRFHDALHLAMAGCLGWSPIVRWMIGRQRDSDPVTRRIEDSGRAKVVEEAVAAVSFEYASRQHFLDGVDHIDSQLLTTIMGVVGHLEVRVRSASEWENALLVGFSLWRRLRDEGGGRLVLDTLQRTIEFQPLPRNGDLQS